MLYVDMNLLEFQKKYSDEESCLQAIFDARWPRGFICPYCQHNDGHRVHTYTRRLMQCCLCRRKSSITSGTVFEQSHILLSVWFLMIYFVAQDKGGCGATKLSKQLGVYRNTVSLMLMKIRSAMSARDENLTLAGSIEFDEALLGGRSKSKSAGKPLTLPRALYEAASLGARVLSTSRTVDSTSLSCAQALVEEPYKIKTMAKTASTDSRAAKNFTDWL